MDIHRKSVDMDMDMDVKFHIHGNPGNLKVKVLRIDSWVDFGKWSILQDIRKIFPTLSAFLWRY